MDVNNLPDTVNIDDNVLASTLTDGAIGYAKMDADIGKSLITRIKLANGQYPPLGSVVKNNVTGKVSGIIAESGIVYLTGLNMGDQLSVNWGDAQACTFSRTVSWLKVAIQLFVVTNVISMGEKMTLFEKSTFRCFTLKRHEPSVCRSWVR
ncbi:FimD/PapC C-terminal domain-containing protein [Providencia hangzhouensis]|uniref:FimD/PapC C-terminal domain-containing protein n=1 Tax=Providencia hangzhouensis TaxID=3031799 RepID=UPI0034DCF3ED